MMKKGILYKILIIPLLLIPLVCPFHISADTNYPSLSFADSSINSDWIAKGGNVSNYCDDVLTTGTPCKLNFTFNDSFYGYITFRGGFGSNYRNNLIVRITAGQGYYEYNTITSSPYQITNVRIDYIGLSLNNDVDLTPIINLLNQNNEYLYELMERKDYVFPIESFTIIRQAMDSSFPIVNFYQFSNYIYPIFQAPANTRIGRQWCGPSEYAYFVFGYEVNLQMRNYTDYLNIVNGDVISIDELYYSDSMTIKKFTIQYNGSSSGFIEVNNINSYKYMPIWFGRYTTYLSTDFAINIGMTNGILDAISKIADGTSNSNTSADNLETVSDDISSSSADLIQSENSFNNSMNSNLQQIDTNINIGNLGSKFLASADWVRMQFNTLTNGTPFGSVLSFSLLLGLALVLVGRIRK